jgi:hypothetical protein
MVFEDKFLYDNFSTVKYKQRIIKQITQLKSWIKHVYHVKRTIP